MEKIKTLLIRLEKIHRAYKNPKTTEDLKSRLFDGSSSLIEELVAVGYPKDFVEALLMYGSELFGNCEDFKVDKELLLSAERVFSGEWLLIKVAEHTLAEGYREAAFWAWKSGYPLNRTMELLAKWTGQGILHYEGRDMWAANVTTRAKYGYAKIE